MRSSIKLKLAALGVVPIILFLAVILGQLVPETKDQIYEQKKEQVQHLVESQMAVLERFHDLEEDGELSKEEAQEAAKETISEVRFGPRQEDYFWINDMHPVMVMHPYKPELNGEDVSDTTDPDGVHIFKRMVEKVEEQGSGFVPYKWQYYDQEDRVEPKMSYVQEFEPWGWVLGTGVYIDDVDAVAQESRNSALLWGGAIALVVGAVVAFLLLNILRPLMRSIAFAKGMSQGDLDNSLEIKSKDELGQLAASLNEVRGSVNGMIWDVEQMSGDLMHGNVRARLPAENYEGVFSKLAENVNGSLEGLVEYLDAVPSPILIIDTDYKVLWMNRAGADTVGQSKEGVEGKKCHELLRTNDCNTDSCACKRAMRSGEGVDSETRANPGESVMDIAYSGIPIKSKKGDIVGAIEFVTDLTQIKDSQRKMQEVAQRASNVADSVSSASEELSSQVEQASHGAEQQSSRISETATSMEEMNATVLEVAKNASGAAEQTDSVKTKAQEGADVVRQSVQAINEVQQQAVALKNSLDSLGKHSEEIGKVMNVIEDIADQTNLLALNAAIEAARAGEAGKGFAVVADEVRKLAEKTMQATKDVSEYIQTIQDSTNSNVEGMDKAARAVEQATDLANRSGQALEEIVSLVQEAADQVRSIATASEEQSSASEEVNKSVEEVNRIAKETSDAMTQSAQAITELAGQASELQKIISDLR